MTEDRRQKVRRSEVKKIRRAEGKKVGG